MKTTIRSLKLTLTLLALICTLHLAQAFYMAEAGRWINRDPLGEAGGENLYSYAYNTPLNLIDPNGLLSKCECDALRAQIYRKALELLNDMRKYDPIGDALGGFPKHGGGVTVPGGHYIEIKQRQSGIKKDLGRYLRECINNNDDNNPSIPRFIDEMASRPVQRPIFPVVPKPSLFQPFDSWSVNEPAAIVGLGIATGGVGLLMEGGAVGTVGFGIFAY